MRWKERCNGISRLLSELNIRRSFRSVFEEILLFFLFLRKGLKKFESWFWVKLTFRQISQVKIEYLEKWLLPLSFLSFKKKKKNLVLWMKRKGVEWKERRYGDRGLKNSNVKTEVSVYLSTCLSVFLSPSSPIFFSQRYLIFCLLSIIAFAIQLQTNWISVVETTIFLLVSPSISSSLLVITSLPEN